MKIPIVDESDNIIEYKEKSELTPNDINRDAALWILNEKNEILLGKRSSNKKVNPNLWTVAVAGTVEEGETYESNIIKEAEEEIGLQRIEPVFLYKDFKNKVNKRMSGVFKIVIPSGTDFKIEPKEVAELRWFTKDEIVRLIQQTPGIFTPNFPNSYAKFIEYENQN